MGLQLSEKKFPSKLKLVTKWKDIRKLIKYCKQTKYCSFDFETNGEPYHAPTSYITVMGVSFQPGSAWVIPMDHFDSKFKGKARKILRLFDERVFSNWDVVKVAWNFKFEYKWLMKYGIIPKGVLFDGMLAKYCLDEERPMGLKEFVNDKFQDFYDYEKHLPKGPWDKKPLKPLAKYCGIDCDLTLRSMIFMEPKLIKLGFYNLFRNLLMMATRVLAESEFNGVKVDRPYLVNLMEKYGVLIEDQTKALNKLPAVVKFVKRNKTKNREELINKLKLEIEEINAGKSKQKVRMIKARKAKINSIISGSFTGKVGKLKLYEGINFNSPDQLIELLFTSRYGLKKKVVKYTVDKKTKKATKRPSTDEEVLLALSKGDGTGLLDGLLKLRELGKLYSTYIKGVMEILSFNSRVHASFLIHGTVTGRLSCVEPNLQNIPRDTTASDIKRMYLPDEGHLLLEVDYGQAELRVLAEMAEDPVMIDIFKKNYNIHVATAIKAAKRDLLEYNTIKGILSEAEKLPGYELEKKGNEEFLFWTKQKKKAKTINFGIIYGQGDDKLAEGMGCSKEEASEFKNDWKKTYPASFKKMGELQKFAQKHGYVKNMFGRKRRLPNATFRDKHEAIRYNMLGKWSEALRQAVNAPIQGTGSDFGLLSQIVIRKKRMLGEFPKTFMQLYTVHDSIGYNLPPIHVHWVVPKVIKICDNPETQKYFGFKLKHVAMKVSPELGLNWGQLKGYDSWENYNKWIK